MDKSAVETRDKGSMDSNIFDSNTIHAEVRSDAKVVVMVVVRSILDPSDFE